MKIITFVSSVFLSFPCFGQSEFAPFGAEWNYEIYFQQWHPPFTTYYDQYTIKIPKDTLINGRIYKIAERNSKGNFFGVGNKKTQYIRQEKGIIIILLDKEYILYNFDAKLHDTVLSTAKSNFFDVRMIETIIEEITYDTISGEIYKIQDISYPCFPGQSHTYNHQKFGCLSEFMDVFFPEDICPVDPPYFFKLRCYSEDNVLIKNFDSIPCDSIRPAFIRTTTNQIQETQAVIYLVKDQLYIMNKSRQEMKELKLININGQILYTFKKQELISAINISKLASGFYITSLQFENGQYYNSKIFIE